MTRLFSKKKEEEAPMPLNKFDIGETVWRLHHNKAEQITVQGVVALYDGNAGEPKRFSSYRYRLEKSEVTSYNWTSEEELFSSKEDLVASL